jgi:ribosomal protein L37E/uncharacterized membrane protein
MSMQSTTQRKLLLGFIASICLCGIIGIYCLAVGDMSRLQERILGTTVIVAALFILALAAALPWHRRTWHPIGPISFIPLLPTLVLALLEIWPSLVQDRWTNANYEYRKVLNEAMAISWTIAVALPLIGLLSLARLKRQWEWVRNTTAVFILALSLELILGILFEISVDEWWRLTGVTAILATCGTITVPILHRVSSIPRHQEVHTAELMLSISCPRCGRTEKLPAGRSQCSHCALRFVIQIEEETCRQCGYPLYKIESAVCPECGTPIAREDPTEA